MGVDNIKQLLKQASQPEDSGVTIGKETSATQNARADFLETKKRNAIEELRKPEVQAQIYQGIVEEPKKQLRDEINKKIEALKIKKSQGSGWTNVDEINLASLYRELMDI